MPLSIRKISFNYPGSHEFKGIRNFSLEVSPGQVIAITGESGSGKSTVLKCIYGLVDINAGEVTINGEKVEGPSNSLMPGHPEMQLVSQDYYVLDYHTVAENIADKLVGIPLDQKKKRIDKILRLLNLTKLANIQSKNLSSGQKQRVAIARALAQPPAVLLLDEPFSNIDRMLSERIFDHIRRDIISTGTSVLFVTHDPEEAMRWSEYMVVMDKGRAIQFGKTLDVYYHPNNLRLASLLGPLNVFSKEDFEKGSSFRKKKKSVFRPDQVIRDNRNPDFHGTIQQSNFNGKCFQSLGVTDNGVYFQIYSQKELPLKTSGFRLLT